MGAVEQAVIYTDAQVKNKQKELDDLGIKCDNLKSVLKQLQDDFNLGNKKLIDELNSREATIKSREKELPGIEAELKTKLNFARESESNVINKIKELDSLKQDFTVKLSKIKNLVDELSK